MNDVAIIVKGLSSKAFVSSLFLMLTFLAPPCPVMAQEQTDASEAAALARYNDAMAAGNRAEAAKHILEYTEQTEGEFSPKTVALTQSYGNLLRIEGEIWDAVDVLKEARERGIVAYGEHGIEMFQINLDLGDVYVDRDIGIGRPRQYFDDALEVLRENGQHETILYVKALMGIASRLTQAGALEGAFSADSNGDGLADFADFGTSSVIRRYRSGFGVLEDYIDEAQTLAAQLDYEDPYMNAKIAIVRARIKVIETMYLEAVPPNIRGSITGTAAQEKYDTEDSNLAAAIKDLSTDADLNREYLDIANGARMEIAWLNDDMERMIGFCESNTLNLARRFPPERLFEIEPDGTVIAPRFSFRIDDNIFDQLDQKIYDARMDASRRGNSRRSQRPNDSPKFIPVCINGRLMAALVNAPTVTIEDLN